MSAQFPKGWRGTELYSVCSPNTMPHNSMGLLSAMTIIIKTKAPEARD